MVYDFPRRNKIQTYRPLREFSLFEESQFSCFKQKFSLFINFQTDRSLDYESHSMLKVRTKLNYVHVSRIPLPFELFARPSLIKKNR